MNATLIIAEAGVNHNGCVERAKALVDAAVDAGADIVKFQTFKAENLVTKQAKQAVYQQKNTGKTESQYHMLKSLELSFEEHLQVRDYAVSQEIEYLSTAFDHQSLSFLTNTLSLSRLKIPSGDITNAPLLLAHAYTQCDLIVSTGMATVTDIENALAVLAYGFLHPENKEIIPTTEAFKASYESKAGQDFLKRKVSLLHCTTEYPAPINEVNLNAMATLSNIFSLPVGYSDHTAGILIPVAAVAKGAHIIEKHFTLSRNLPGPDHKASLEPSELKQMIENIRIIESALGSEVKAPTNSEKLNIPIARKSIVAATNIKQGERFTLENLTVLRPGDGVSPMEYYDYIQQTANRNYQEGELIHSQCNGL